MISNINRLNMSKRRMNKVIGQLVLALALVSLTGCGLKGPLYFPPSEQPKAPQPPLTKQTTPGSTVQKNNDADSLKSSTLGTQAN